MTSCTPSCLFMTPLSDYLAITFSFLVANCLSTLMSVSERRLECERDSRSHLTHTLLTNHFSNIIDMSNKTLVNLLVLGLISLAEMAEGAKASCRAARRCCHIEDDDCLVFQASQQQREQQEQLLEEEIENEAIEPCYCDAGCPELGDCCPDYHSHCRMVVDCEVGEWSAWSSCSCSGGGSSTRKRHVLKRASNGGNTCPRLQELRQCTHHPCNHRRHVSAFRETAILVSSEFAIESKSGYEVRANLKSFRRNQRNRGLDKDTRYCVTFRVEKAAKACLQESRTSLLQAEMVLSVGCDQSAQRGYLGGRCIGHGVRGKRTKFKSVLNEGCHGKWVRIDDENDENECEDFDFVFV